MITQLLLALSSLALAKDYPLPPPPAVSTGTRLEFSADHLDYAASSATLHLKGHVLIVQSTRTIKADELWLDTKRRAGRSGSALFVEDGESAVAGESGEFYFEEHAGRLDRASAGHGDWRVHAKQARLAGRNKLDYFSADFTSCDYTPPHYHFHAGRISVVPKKHLVARNVTFFLGPVPILYLPFFYKSLDPNHFLRMRFQPGYDRRNGVYVKGTMVTRHSPWLYSKLYLDYFSSQGIGEGLELERRKDDSRGVLFGYHVRENSSGTERWALLGNLYQAIISSVSLQGRLQLQSDAEFNNHYSRSSVLRVTPELDNSGAVVYRQRRVTMRLSYSRHDVSLPNKIKYVKTSESNPRFDLQTTQLQIWKLPWLNTFSAFADNTYLQGRPFPQKSAGGGWEAVRTLPVARGVSFAPKVAFQQNWFDKIEVAAGNASSSTLQDVFIGRYQASPTLRWSTFFGNWDFTHFYTRRLRANSMADDAGAPDHGVEANLSRLEDIYRPARSVLLRAFSGYDFRVFRDRSVGFRERVQPFVGEVVYTPRPSWSYTLRNDYQLQEGERSFLATMLCGREDRSFISLGAGYNKAVTDRYALDTQFTLSNASATWRIGGVLRSEFFTSGGPLHVASNRFHLFEKEITLTRAWHDFYTKLLLRFRPGGVREGTLRVELKFGKGANRAAPARRDWEAEWFPERASGAHDRP